MKNVLALAFATALSLALVACGGSGSGQAATDEAPATAETTETPATTEAATDEPESPSADARGSESALQALMQEMDPESGIHLNYGYVDESNEFDLTYDVHIKGDSVYITYDGSVGSLSGGSTRLTTDGKAYTLYPDEKRAVYATSASALNGSQYLQDYLIREMWTHAKQDEYDVEERTVDGVTYTVEVYPAPNEYQPGASFFFDDQGELARCEVDAYEVSGNEFGEVLYTVNTIDDDVDESLFDLSDYTIETL